MDTYATQIIDYLEADDVLGILQSEFVASGRNSVITSIDKDLFQVPGWHYSIDTWESKFVSDVDARKVFLLQVLAGDKDDGVPGCPGVGKAIARSQFMRRGWSWQTVVLTYEVYGGLDRRRAEAAAIHTARLVFVLRHSFVDTGRSDKLEAVRLWNPEDLGPLYSDASHA